MGRTPCCSKVGLHRGPWSAKEDKLLTNYIQAHGEGKWRTLPKKAGLLRCGKSCRLRWKNYLCPSIKRGNIIPDEEDLIICLHSLLGNRWSLIAQRLPSRTDNEIKNHWNTHLIKRLTEVGIEPKSNKINAAKMPKESKKSTRPTLKDSSTSTESNNAIPKRKHNNTSSNCSDTEPVAKIKIHVPKPIRVLPGFSSSDTDGSVSRLSSPEGVNKEAMLNESHYYSGSEVAEEKHVLIPDCEFSFEDLLAETVSFQDSEAVSLQDLLPSSSNMLEKIYDEYLQLL